MKIKKILLLLAIVSFTVMSCTNVEEEVVGTWTFQTFDTQEQGACTWVFEEDGTLLRILTYEAISSFPGGISFDTANYFVDKSFFKTQIVISGSDPLWTPSAGMGDVNGTFRIDKLKEDILTLTRINPVSDTSSGGYLRCEMIRKQ